MDPQERLKILSSDMDFELAEDHRCPKIESKKKYSGFVHPAVMPNGKRISLLKTLLTSACERDCHYCPFRAGRNFRRTSLKPDEMAQIFMGMQRAGIVEGLFLSSGLIGGGISTQDRLIATAEILRNKLGFKGYLHLKIMPGAEISQVEQAMRLANRVSINLEAPNTKRLKILAPNKEFGKELLQPLKWINAIRSSKPSRTSWIGRWPSVATQFVVGGAGESDVELLSTTEYLYKELNLRRAYYSPFNPVKDTPLEGQPATNLKRESRLYQASFLIRDYGFSMEELPFNQQGNLPQDADPKLSWANLHLKEHPVEINKANREQLLRIPGIGPKGAATLVRERRKNRLKSVEELRKIGINPARVSQFILLDGHRPSRQISFL